MSSSSPAVFVAFVVALSGFSSAVFYAPVGYPIDSLWEHGLIKVISFDKVSYSSPCMVSGHLVLRNPSGEDVVVDVEDPPNWTLISETSNPRVGYSISLTKRVTIPAGGEYVFNSFSFRALGPGYYVVDWGGFSRGVEVYAGELISRLVVEKSVYGYGENGYLTFEYYNPRPYAVELTRPSQVWVELFVNGVDQQTGFVSFIDYFNETAALVVVPPGETVKITSFYFTTYEPGSYTYRGMGASVTFTVLSRTP